MTGQSGLVLMGLSALAFSLMAAVIKVLNQDIPASEIIFFRGVICSILTVAAMRASSTSLRGQRQGMLVVRGLLGFAGLYLYTAALGRIALPDAIALQYTHPIFAAVFGALLLREKMPKNSGLALSICAAGALIILNPQATGDLTGNLIGLGSGVASALAYVSVRSLSKTESPLLIMLAFHVAALVCGAILMVPEFVWPTGITWFWLLIVALVSQAGQWLLTHGLRKEQAGVATMVSYLAIAFGTGWAWLFFDDPIHATVLIGTGMMVLGLALMNASRRRAAAQAAQFD